MVDCSDVFAGSIQGGHCPASVLLRQPATPAAVVPLFLSIYAQAMLAILPNFSTGVAEWLGFENDE
jgi:hypothetical protein